MIRAIAVSFVAVTVMACATAPRTETTPGPGRYSRVSVLSSDPDSDCTQLGAVEATDGSGVGLFGTEGTYQGAIALLQESAGRRGATHVRVDNQVPPHAQQSGETSVFVNTYVIRGLAFRCETTDTVATLTPSCVSAVGAQQRRDELQAMRDAGRLPPNAHAERLAKLDATVCEAESDTTSDPELEQHDTGAVANPTTDGEATAHARLRELKRLHEDGLITDEEYDAKRAEILAEL